jgi:hypothetical protein
MGSCKQLLEEVVLIGRFFKLSGPTLMRNVVAVAAAEPIHRTASPVA